ncbi:MULTISPECIES: L-serine ammonia-lyase, iron-sulfur-dependent subunit beta [Brevibacillus]|uniref:L-serine deaminase n=1 Tax=Brevibacillus nitrificans TaxID=651560 RepID=A0A3M8DIN8_9BACL|nr:MULTISPECIES: L-serine ammonia-lyase, iron-sulfur-dependent subunit beta [Brevibacillus]MDR7317346.1 L-serine dehydratase [Brevibacillus nitrificans]MEC2128299.1 L-serine ammonia-lyase, iron-sulfur-dependent subunit beta [Brevibacillus centrosporus]MED1794254.1 L-serine ammonia-lyase, iron-sulfur-dependent subunit beta [Brevibacillus nitrificans]MED1953938.1 L-serine ammonia-lyase, iron-sulfur-dependent subunit beta [Brevibacillus centrosporus]MED4909722.1 L-serine ammonia-lyase, iron-sulfu
MKYKSVFDIIGPIMVGPSSSHTAGAARIGRVARKLFGKEPKRAKITFYGSFAKTYQGHGSDVATVAGILDFDTSDLRLKNSLLIAEKAGMEVDLTTSEVLTEHPNTARIKLSDDQESIEVVGVSIGGGKIEVLEINGFTLQLGFDSPTMLVLHEDRFGMIAAVAKILTQHKINVGLMEVSRHDRGARALMAIETDAPVSAEVLEEIRQIPYVFDVSLLSLN